MKSLLNELENNEAVLIMYLGDELPPADRAEVEQMLRDDASLRREFEALRGESRLIENALRTGDGTRHAPHHAAAARRASSAIRQWSTARQFQEPAPAPRTLRFPWWTYPAAAAAMVTVVFFVWWSKQPDDLSPMRMSEPLAVDEADGRYPTFANAGMDDISRIERQLDAVVALREMVR